MGASEVRGSTAVAIIVHPQSADDTSDCDHHERRESTSSDHGRCLMPGPCTTVAVVGPVVMIAKAPASHEAPAALSAVAPIHVTRTPDTPPPRT